MRKHTLRPLALILLSVIVTGIGLVVAHCADPRLARAQPIVVEWPEP